MNKCTFIGRLTEDAELKETTKGTPVSNFRIAVNDRRSDDVLYMNVASFGKQAENLTEYLTKGTLIYVEGRLRLEEYEKDGVQRTALSIVANDIELGPKRTSE